MFSDTLTDLWEWVESEYPITAFIGEVIFTAALAAACLAAGSALLWAIATSGNQ